MEDTQIAARAANPSRASNSNRFPAEQSRAGDSNKWQTRFPACSNSSAAAPYQTHSHSSGSAAWTLENCLVYIVCCNLTADKESSTVERSSGLVWSRHSLVAVPVFCILYIPVVPGHNISVFCILQWYGPYSAVPVAHTELLYVHHLQASVHCHLAPLYSTQLYVLYSTYSKPV